MAPHISISIEPPTPVDQPHLWPPFLAPASAASPPLPPPAGKIIKRARRQSTLSWLASVPRRRSRAGSDGAPDVLPTVNPVPLISNGGGDNDELQVPVPAQVQLVTSNPKPFFKRPVPARQAEMSEVYPDATPFPPPSPNPNQTQNLKNDAGANTLAINASGVVTPRFGSWLKHHFVPQHKLVKDAAAVGNESSSAHAALAPAPPVDPSSTCEMHAPPPSPPPASPAPQSQHDAVVNKLLERPGAPVRSNSLPSRKGAGAAEGAQLKRSASIGDEDDDERQVTALLDGPMDPSGSRVTRALSAQIEAVLSAQEEIGRAHLALERVGVDVPVQHKGEEGQDFEELRRRAESVDEIMNKLSQLATSLKSYHAIGTPMIAFPRRAPATAAAARSPLSPRAPQIQIANPGIAAKPSDSLLSELSSPWSGSGVVQSPSAMSPAAEARRSASASATGSAKVPGGMSTSASTNTISSMATPLGAPPPPGIVAAGMAHSASAPSRPRSRPNVWISRAGLADDGVTASPIEMSPTVGTQRPWEEASKS